jgi:hypothetical protein
VRYALLAVLLAAGLLIGSAFGMVADTTTDTNCYVSTGAVHLANPAPGHLDVDVYSEAACNADTGAP